MHVNSACSGHCFGECCEYNTLDPRATGGHANFLYYLFVDQYCYHDVIVMRLLTLNSFNIERA